MIIVTYRRADGREDTLRLNVNRDRAADELNEIYPDATVLSVEEEKPAPSLPDPDVVESRNWEDIQSSLIAFCEDVLGHHDIDVSDMNDDKIVKEATTYLDPDARDKVFGLLRRVNDELS